MLTGMKQGGESALTFPVLRSDEANEIDIRSIKIDSKSTTTLKHSSLKSMSDHRCSVPDLFDITVCRLMTLDVNSSLFVFT